MTPTKISLVMLLAVALAGCATAQSVTLDGKALCGQAWRQINIQAADRLTSDTAIAIEANNLAREAAGCKYEPPSKKVASKPLTS